MYDLGVLSSPQGAPSRPLGHSDDLFGTRSRAGIRSPMPLASLAHLKARWGVPIQTLTFGLVTVKLLMSLSTVTRSSKLGFEAASAPA